MAVSHWLGSQTDASYPFALEPRLPCPPQPPKGGFSFGETILVKLPRASFFASQTWARFQGQVTFWSFLAAAGNISLR